MDEIDAALNELRKAPNLKPKQAELFPEDEIDSALKVLRGEQRTDDPLAVPIPPRKPTTFDVDLDQLHLNLQKAATANPTEAARKSALSKALNLPLELLPPDAEEQAFYRANDPVGLLKEYPEIANYLNQADNASIGGKNIENLKKIRTAMRRATVDPVVSAAKGTVAVPEAIIGIADIFSKGKAGKAVEDAGISFKGFKERLDTLYSPEQQEANAKLQKAEGFLETAGTALENPSTITNAIVESVPLMLTGGAVGQTIRRFFPKVSALVAGAVGEGTVMAGSTAERIRQQTESGELTGTQAALAAGVGVVGGSVGVLSAKLMQRFGFGDIDTALASGKLNDALVGSGMPRHLITRVLAGGVSEGALEEMPQSAVEQIAENVALGKPWDEGVPEAMAIGLLTGTAMGSGVQLLTAGAQPEASEEPLDKDIDRAGADALRGLAKAVQAEEHRNSLDALIKTAANDPMRKGAPEAFKDFVSTMAEEDGSIEEVYVDGKLLEGVLQQSGVDIRDLQTKIPTLRRDLQNALQTNGDVRIAIDDFATHLIDNGVGEQLLDNLRTDPDGMTYQESQQFYQSQKEEFTKQAEELIAKHQPVLTRAEFQQQEPEGSYEDYLKSHTNKAEVFAKDAQEVHDKILTGMNQARRFNRFVNEVYAVPFREFYTVNAAREGILPSELYARLPLNFSKMQIEQGFMQPEQAAERNLANFEVVPAATVDFTPENIPNIISKDNWAILTASNPEGKVQSAEENAEANAKLKAELESRGLQYESVFGMYPNENQETESLIVYGIDQEAAHELGNKYRQESILTREGLVYNDNRVTPVKSVLQFENTAQAAGIGYTRIPSTNTIFTFDLDFSKEKQVRPGAMTLHATHYSHERRAFLEGARAGTGLPAAERDRLEVAEDPRIRQRIDFYADLGNGVTPEAGLGPVRHDVVLHNIYNGAKNPLKFKVPYRPDGSGMNDFESQVIDAGFDGYYVKQGQQGRVVLLGNAATSVPTEGGSIESGREGILPQQARSYFGTREADGSLQGLPRKVGGFTASHWAKAEKVAKEYIAKVGLIYTPPNTYATVNEERARRIAKAFDEMEHNPQDPMVKAAYEALARETIEQYRAVVEAGLVVEFINFEETGDPYEGSPRRMTEDVRENNHMWVFSTREGFGSSDFDPKDNPLLAETEFVISGQKALVNDLFRVVHDYFGHVKEGVGFRAAGEENAWRAHMSMFSPLAGRALTTETRGQNSWVNFGPFAEHNKTASGADTRYADQKIGLLPEWVSTEGAGDEILFQSVRLMKQTENLKKYGLDPNKSYTTRQVAAALEARQRAKYGMIEAGDYSPESLRKISSWIVEEVSFEMDNPSESGVGWYSERFQRALDNMGEKYPELLTDKNARNTFTALLAITSDGQRVTTNLSLADDIYGRYKSTGKFSISGQQQPSVPGNLVVLQDLYDQMGVETAHEFLLSERTLSELKKLAAEHGKTLNSPYQADFKLPMAALAFGPKLGAFYANLMGSHGYLTMDRWWSRTFNRYRGTLLTAPTKSSLANFRTLLGQEQLSDDETIAATVGPHDAYEARNFRTQLAELMGSSEPTTDKAKVVWFAKAREKAGDQFEELLAEHNIERAANTIYKKAFDNLEDTPFGAKDRTFMADAIKAAQKKLKSRGVNVSIADIQAILWYYEKKLYGKMGAKQSGVISYEEAARRLVNGETVGADIERGPGTATPEMGGGEVSVGEETYNPALNQSAFYSALEREIIGLRSIGDKQGMIQPHQAMKWIESRQREGKFKKEEVEAVGLTEWLEVQQDKISIESIERFVRENGVQIEETILSEDAEVEVDEYEVFDLARDLWEEDTADLNFEDDEEAEANWNLRIDVYLDEARERLAGEVPSVEPVYAGFQLPGGQDYKELLLTLPGPEKVAPSHFRDVGVTNIIAHTRINTRFVTIPLTAEQEAEIADYEKTLADITQQAQGAIADKKRTAQEYEATLQRLMRELNKPITELLDDMPPELEAAAEANREASARVIEFSNRVPKKPEFTRRQEKVLFVEEIQSDWAQQGRDIGFEQPLTEEEAELKALGDKSLERDLTPEELERAAVLRERVGDGLIIKRGQVAPGPFVRDTKTWTSLVAKRLLRYAAENGFDRIAWTTGDQQNARYNLADTVKQIEATLQKDGRYYVVAEGVRGRALLADFYAADQLPGIVGQSVADKILKNATELNERTVFKGEDLELGGEGMRGFYDRIVPSVFNDISKKLGGGRVEPLGFLSTDSVKIKKVEGEVDVYRVFVNGVLRMETTKAEAERMLERHKLTADPDRVSIQQSLAVTPEMRERVMQGLPLFQGPRAGFNPQAFTISLLQGSDLSSVIHEGGHFYLEALANLAVQPNAVPQVRDDFAKTIKWFGLPEDTDWAAMSLENKRQYHEQWAQSFERYTMEGKAPTLEMQPVFARFRSWMLNIYKSMKEFLRQNPLAGKLNDDIRGVFDRLIASEEAIAAAEKARRYAPLFPSAEEAGVTSEQFNKYMAEGEAATQIAIDQLNSRSIRDMKWLTGARSQILKKLQAEAKIKRASIRAEVEQEVNEEPVNRARLFFSKGKFLDADGQIVEAQAAAKLNLAEIKALKPDFTPSQLRGMTSEDGIALDLAAQMFGYDSGEALIDDMINGENAKAKIEGLTDQRMLQEHGDLIDEQALENAADEAVHNEARARFMATGLKMLTATNASPRELAKAAKQAAESTIASKLIREISPGQFARAEAKANAEAIKLAPRDRVKAAEAQRAALLNNKLAKVAGEARREVDAILRYVKKFDGKPINKAIDIEYMEQIYDLLRPFNFKSLTLRQIDKNKTLTDWVNEQEANGFEPAIDPALMEELKIKHYKNMTLEELRGLRDTIKQIEHIGRYKHKLLTALDKREFQERIREADESIRDNANRTAKEYGTPTDLIGRTGQWFRQIAAAHRKFNSVIREMDGGKDNGVMWNLLSRGMNDAGNAETEQRQQAAKKMAQLFKMINLEQSVGNISAKKRLVPGTRISMTHEQRLMFAMNWGNAGNRQRLLDGGITGQRALSITEANAILDTLTENEWNFIQATWDFIGGYRDQIAALERKMTGVEPKWIDPAPITTKFGVYRGGYFPAKYDTELSTRSEALEASVDLRLGMQGVFQSAATRNGYTKERSDKVIGRPLLLSFDVIPRHVNEVIHRISWQPWLTDANRVLKALDLPIREHYGTEILRELRDTVNDIAVGDAPPKDALEAAINRLRVGSTIVGMGWRVATALLQPSGLAQSSVRIGAKWISKGMFQFLTSPLKSASFVDAKSSLMKNRGITMQREINEVLNTLRSGETVSAVTASYFSMIGKMQRMVDIPTWLGAYEKALAELKYENALNEEQRKEMEDKAVALANQAVIDSQSGGMIQDLAKVQRGSPLRKILTNFYSYFSATYNLNVEAVRKTNFLKPTEVLVMANNLLMLNVVPVLFSVALKEAIKGECGDDIECLTEKAAQEQVSFMLGQIVGLREVASGATVLMGGPQFGYQGPAGLRFFGDLYKAGVQIEQGELDMTLFKSINNATGAVFHYPAGQINTTLDGILAIEEGRVEGVSILPALLFGPPRD